MGVDGKSRSVQNVSSPRYTKAVVFSKVINEALLAWFLDINKVSTILNENSNEKTLPCGVYYVYAYLRFFGKTFTWSS